MRNRQRAAWLALAAALLVAGCAPAGSATRSGQAVADAALPAGFSAVGTDRDPATGLPGRIRQDQLGYELVLVPAGTFTMGSPAGVGFDNERPAHPVTLRAYYIGVTEVSNRQFRQFRPAHDSGTDQDRSLNGDDQPAVRVTWDEAAAFCARAGMRLPTEAQWERAARGVDGRTFAWGEAWPPPPGAANLMDERARRELGGHWDGVAGYDDGFAVAGPVGAAGAAEPFGTRDLGGNVSEWCADRYRVDYYRESPAVEPTGAAVGSTRVLRGGSWRHHRPENTRSAFRLNDAPSVRRPTYGFRCALVPGE